MRLPQSLLALAGIFLADAAFGQAVPSSEPSSTHIFPAGGRRGTVVKVRVGGECLPPGMNIKILGEGVTGPSVLGKEVKARYEPSLRRVPRDADAVGASMSYPREFEASLTIAPNAEPGVRFWSVSGAWGGTRPRPFLVGELPEFVETEPNSQPELAERITLPVVVNGQISGERDQDFFVFSAKAGDVVVCDVMAARIGSPLEPVIAILDTLGNRQEVQEIRVGNDPVVSFRVPISGDYRIHVANLSYYGGPAYVYRITVSTRPYAAFAFPAGGPAGQTRALEVFTPTGTGLFRAAKKEIAFPQKPGPFHTRDGLVLVAGELPEIVETDDNHSFQSAMDLKLPVTVNARFLKAGEEDWFRFTAKKNDRFTIACGPWPPASAAVPLLTIHDPTGGVLAKIDGARTPDPALEIDWQAPADGAFRLRLRDFQHRSGGGPEFVYRLTVRPAQPSFSLRLETDYVNVVQGGKTEIDLLVKRMGGFTGPIDLSAEGLPEGVRIEPAHVAGDQTRVKLALLAKDAARPTDAVVRIIGKALVAGKSTSCTATVSSIGSEGDALHLTIQHKPIFRLSCKETYQYAPRGSIHPYLMKIERFDDFNGPIVLQLCDRQVQDLDGVEILETVVPPGAKEAMNLIYFPETMHASVQAHSRPYAQAYATFTDNWGQKQVLLAVSTHRCMVRTLPPVVKLRSITKEIVVRPGEVAECVLALERNSTFTGPAEVALMDSPGLTAPKVQIEPDQNEAVLRIRISRDMRKMDSHVLRFRATGRLAAGETAITEATVAVRIEIPAKGIGP
jgi:hypothetical protein